jgi:uncharacterized protein (TIGR03000 family)
MRYLLAAVLSGTILISSSSTALAQRGRGGSHPGGTNQGGHPGGYHGVYTNGYHGGYYGGNYNHGGYYGHGSYYGNYWYPGFGLYVGLPLWFNYPWGYSRYDYGMAAPYYSGSYYYGPADAAVPAPPSYDTINASTTAVDPNSANIEVRVPENATVWINGQSTTPTGAVRHFTSPPLEKDKTFTYDFRARWTDATGKEVERTKQVDVKAGAWVGVDFNRQS